MPGTPRFLTLADVAEVLNTSSAQVYALVRRGDLPAIKIGGRGQWRVEAAQLEDYIAADVRRGAHVRRRAPLRRGRAQPEHRASPTAARLSRPRSPSVIRTVRSSPSRRTVNSQRLAGLVGPDRHDQRDAVGDPLAVDRGDHVALLQPAALSAGVSASDLVDLGAGRRRRSPVCTLAPITG